MDYFIAISIIIILVLGGALLKKVNNTQKEKKTALGFDLMTVPIYRKILITLNIVGILAALFLSVNSVLAENATQAKNGQTLAVLLSVPLVIFLFKKRKKEIKNNTAKIISQKNFCSFCGKELIDNNNFCSNCGEKLKK